MHSGRPSAPKVEHGEEETVAGASKYHDQPLGALHAFGYKRQLDLFQEKT
jgi:hypothetical protein